MHESAERSSATAESAAATAAQQKDDPDPVTAETWTSAARTVMFASATAAAAAQNQDQPDQITASAASVVAVTSTICCSKITHVNSSKNLVTLHSMCRCLSVFLKFFKLPIPI
jgi:3-oxoacyl-ACP reductase-like protein